MFVPKSLFFKTSEVKKATGVQCCAYGCKKKPHDRKGGLCSTHYNIKRRIEDPVYARYANFKHNALRRPLTKIKGEKFTITLEEFRGFCQRTGYIIKKGMRGRNCTIDRVKNCYGYHIWNIQIKSMAANIAKYHNEDKHMTELPEEHEDYLPF